MATHPATNSTPAGPLRSGNRILTINGGSSSIKFALYDPGESLQKTLAGAIERIGLADSSLHVNKPGQPNEKHPLPAGDPATAITGLIDWLDRAGELGKVAAIGYRVVHGGPAHTEPQTVTPELLADLRQAIPLAPNHLPIEIRLIETAAARLPGVPQVVCFDTTFHNHLPTVARTLPIPRRYAAAGVHRYGFHGLSYAYLLEELEKLAGPEAARGRVIFAHLGNGASLAAVRDAQCVDTTMGFTPDGGLVMGTRTGDLDPGVLIYLVRTEKLSPDQLEDLVTKQSGLLGVSETSPDMRDLLARRDNDPRAAEAVALFCYQIRKWIGAFAAALGGVDTLVFAGGIGEHAAEVRAGACDGLGFFGVALDPTANAANAPVISAGDGVTVRVIPTDEELMIARTVLRIVGGNS
ncbi:acetate/propionate family kinase [Fimbriiglobus ruber]|uniref:Acetate kinase n=1 Tax=Fimbriiglobus ruber TaxID=1908690 RepID=A0A225DQ10_9BACT|nr:acetate/propionate family kinase [Fimbriiglobus ruber]OWK43203.1 Acetate kinase [Fimbriiglobus ruber]